MNKFENIYIIVPAFNESKVIKKTLSELKIFFKNIIVIDDGSEDDTKEIAKSMGVILLHHPINLGQGASISSAINFLKKMKDLDGAITFDADGQHSAQDAVSFAEEILICDEDIIFGSRFLMHSQNIPLTKRAVLSVVKMMSNFFLGLKHTDAHNGLKAFNKKALDKLSLKIDRYGFETEIIAQLKKHNLKYKELPTNIVYNDYSLKKGQSLRNGIRVLESIVGLIFKK